MPINPNNTEIENKIPQYNRTPSDEKSDEFLDANDSTLTHTEEKINSTLDKSGDYSPNPIIEQKKNPLTENNQNTEASIVYEGL